MADPKRPDVLFLGTTYAGWQTRQANIEAHVRRDGRLRPSFAHVTGWREGGLLERSLPAGVAGRLRAAAEARGFARLPRPDVTWTSCLELAVPYLWANVGPLRRPLVVETDWVYEQQEAMAELYFRRPPRSGLDGRSHRSLERLLFDRVTLFTPISNWAAEGLRRVGVADERIRVLHPGVDLGAWAAPVRGVAEGRPLRVLFVGGDFARKGGPMLVDAVGGPLAGRVEADIVTRDDVAAGAGVRVHRAGPNSEQLRTLFREADLFVLPTRAECFGHAAVEALASGLPVVMGDVGGARDIVTDGETGWLIEPEPAAVVAALERAWEARAVLPAMGARARAAAEQRFDGAANDAVLVDLLLGQHRAWQTKGMRQRPAEELA